MSLLAFRLILFYLCILIVQPQNRFPFLHPYNIADISFIGGAACHAIAYVMEGKPLIRFGLATKLALALLFFGFLSLFVGPLGGPVRWSPWIDILVKNAVVLIFLEAMTINIQRVWAVLATLMLGTLWWIKAGLRLSQAGATYAGDRLMGAAVSLIENPNTFAYMLCIMLPIFLYFAFRTNKMVYRWIFGILAVAAVYIVFETGSRTGFLILFSLGIVILPKFWKQHKGMLIGGGLAVFIVFTSLVSGGNIERFRSIRTSIDSFLKGEVKTRSELTQDEQSAQERRLKNRDTWRLIMAYPVFGVGINAVQSRYTGRFPYASGQVHNEILAAGRQMGFIGMGLYASLVWLLIAYGWRIERRLKENWPDISYMGWAIKLSGVAILVGGFFSPLPWNAVHLTLCAVASSLHMYLMENRLEYAQ